MKNIIESPYQNWQNIYSNLDSEIRKEIDFFRENFTTPEHYDEYQLRVIKRTRVYPKNGDVFLFQPRDQVYFYGMVINAEVSSEYVNGVYVVMLFKDKTSNINEDCFVPNYDNLLVPPLLITRQYWTKGYFYNVFSFEHISPPSYGFYHEGWGKVIDEYYHELSDIPVLLGKAGINTNIGVAWEVNKN